MSEPFHVVHLCTNTQSNHYVSTCSGSCLLHLKHKGFTFLSTVMSRAAEIIIAPKKMQLLNVHPN